METTKIIKSAQKKLANLSVFLTPLEENSDPALIFDLVDAIATAEETLSKIALEATVEA